MNFKTMDEAALAALKIAAEKARADRFEYGGIIVLNDDGTYSFTGPRTDKDHGAVSVTDESVTDKPKGYVANYHIHVEGGGTIFPDKFSPTDGISALLSGGASYLGTADGRQAFKVPSFGAITGPEFLFDQEGHFALGFTGQLIGSI